MIDKLKLLRLDLKHQFDNHPGLRAEVAKKLGCSRANISSRLAGGGFNSLAEIADAAGWKLHVGFDKYPTGCFACEPREKKIEQLAGDLLDARAEIKDLIHEIRGLQRELDQEVNLRHS